MLISVLLIDLTVLIYGTKAVYYQDYFLDFTVFLIHLEKCMSHKAVKLMHCKEGEKHIN